MMLLNLIKLLIPHSPVVMDMIVRVVKANARKLWENAPWILCAFALAACGWEAHKLHERDATIEHMKLNDIRATSQWTQRLLSLEESRQALATHIDQRYQEGIQHGHDEDTATIAALRAGAIRLRNRLAARAPADHVADNRGAGIDHDQTSPGLREQDAEFLVQLADTADNRVRELTACQDFVQGLENEKAIRVTTTHH
ncbi:hypothetical protein LMG33818_002625 [Halomonadaceae bacterium LMG 33818]|uniref:lysis system i-spanin subunit Rz n=1 Tax=Cernens ardua TaxID=3402176 RepID=UPI003EDC830C